MTENTEGTGTPTEGTLVGKPAEAPAAPEQETPTASPEAVSEQQGTEPNKEQDGEAAKSEEVGAPDEYEDFNVPENLEVNAETLDKFKPLAKELNLSQEQAQKLVDFQTEATKQHADSVNDYYSNLMTEWQENVRNDQEIGGTAFDSSIADARAALDKFGTTELMETLETTGMGNHPEFVRVFARMGKAIKEDGIHVGTSAPEGPKDPATILFPDQK